MPEPTDAPENSEDLEMDLFTHCKGVMTLESIVDATGEFEHLNDLVVQKITRCGGISGTGQYMKIVTPLLDLLEVEIRVRYAPGMTRAGMKQVIHDWIECELRELR